LIKEDNGMPVSSVASEFFVQATRELEEYIENQEAHITPLKSRMSCKKLARETSPVDFRI
jgi:hypothetical protein